MGKITILHLLGLFLVEKVYTQDCTRPAVPNGNHVGDLNEGGASAVICNTGYEHGGDPTATCWGGVWTVLPTCSPKDCGQPNNIQNGFLEGETFYQGNAVVTCNAGYTGGGRATCGSAASWTNLPACNAIDCGKPNVDNGVSLGDTDYGGSPFISCYTGYIGGGTALTCQPDGSWEINVSCDPRDCGNPNIANADFSGDTFYTGTANITCHAGYDKGAGSLTCQSSGNWATPKITCDPKDCGTPTITNGQLSTASSTLFGETAVVECNAGYLGGGAVVCLDTGAWGTIPACNPRDCGTEPITNGVMTGSTLYGELANVVCNTGYVGGGDAFCEINGGWRMPLPSCAPIDCGTPDISNGQLEPGFDDTVYAGTSVAMCNAGYIGGGVIQCQADGTWTANPDPCTPLDCGSPTIDHADFTGDTFYTGTPVVTCHAGYNKAGTAVCQTDGTWQLPTCTAKDCGPLNVKNGLFSGTTVYDGSPLISCNTGYDKVGTAKCEANGVWTAPTCDPKDCGDPGIANSQLIGDTVYNEAAFIQCNPGYSGGGTAECLALGIWNSANLPTCTPKDCGTEPITNGVMTGSTLYGELANVVCNTGYVGGGDAFCETIGDWRMPLPSCAPIDCGTPDIPNGQLEPGYDDTVYAGTSIAMCNAGHIGGGEMQCQADGTWTANPDPCTPLDCGALNNPANGAVDTSAGTTYGQTATYSCDTGYNMVGNSQAQCQVDGTWEAAPTCQIVNINDACTITADCSGTNVECRDDGRGPQCLCETGHTPTDATNCEPVDCGGLTGPTDGTISYSDTTVYNSIATYSCNTGYQLTGTATRVCQGDGFWSGAEDQSCQLIDCGSLAKPDNGAVDIPAGTTYGQQATYSCDTGYNMVGNAQVQCQADGVWDAAPTCQIANVCQTTPCNSAVNFPVTTYQTMTVAMTMTIVYSFF